MTLYLGTSGWAYPEWRPGFYPEKASRRLWLSHYARIFDACEINATFYRLQSEKTFARWADGTPDDFVFVAKAHRRLTHGRRRLDPAFLTTFLSSLGPLGGKLGAVLFQFPPTLQRDDDLLERFLHARPSTTRAVFEFRHQSWKTTEIEDRLSAAEASLCIADLSGDPPEALPRGPIGYVRLRAERYTDAQRDAWLRVLSDESRARDVFAFAKHEGAPADDPFTGVGLARWMSQRAG